MKTSKKLCQILLTVLIFLSMASRNVNAASGSVSLSVSSASVTVNTKFKVTITVKSADGIGGAQMVLKYDSSYLTLSKNGAGNNYNSANGKILFEPTSSTSASYTFEFTAKKTGSTNVSVTVSNFIGYKSEEKITGYSSSLSKTVKITEKTPTPTPDKKTTKSSDATLSLISVENQVLEPEFSKDVFTYNIYAPSDTQNLAINATANHAKAKVALPETALQEGWNELKIVCTAENNTQKTYTLNVYVEEKPTLMLKYRDKELGVVKNLDKVDIVSGYVEEDTFINGETVKVFVNDLYRLIYLTDNSGSRNWYLLDQNNEITGIYRPLFIVDKELIITDVNYEEYEYLNEKFEKAQVSINNQTIDGWKYLDGNYEDFRLVSLREGKETRLFNYDTKEGTIQRYVEPEKPKERMEPYIYLSAAAGGAACLLAAVVMVIRNRKVHG